MKKLYGAALLSVLGSFAALYGSNASADSQVGSFIYATSNHGTDGLAKFDTTSMKLLKTIALPNATSPTVLGVDPAQSYVYVERENAVVTPVNTRTVDVISTATDTIVRSVVIPLPAGYTGPITGLNFSPDGSKVFISLTTGNSVLVLSGDLTRQLAVLPLANQLTPEKGTLSPDGAWLYVPNFSTHSVSIINTASNVVQGNQDLQNWSNSANPQSVAVSPDGSTVYVQLHGPYSNGYHGELLALSPNAGHTGFTLIKHIVFPDVQSGVIQLTADGKTLYSVSTTDTATGASTYQVNTETFAVTQQVTAALNSSATFALTRDGNRIIAGQHNVSTTGVPNAPIVSIDPASNQVSSKVNWQPNELSAGSYMGYTSFTLVDTHPVCR